MRHVAAARRVAPDPWDRHDGVGALVALTNLRVAGPCGCLALFPQRPLAGHCPRAGPGALVLALRGQVPAALEAVLPLAVVVAVLVLGLVVVLPPGPGLDLRALLVVLAAVLVGQDAGGCFER